MPPAWTPILQQAKLRYSKILLQLKNFYTILNCFKSFAMSFLDRFNVLTLLFVFKHTSNA